MNILPFVTIFLIILAIYSSFSFKDYKIDKLKYQTLLGSVHAERALRNVITEKYFQKMPKKKIESTIKEKSEPSEKSPVEQVDIFSRNDPQRFRKFNLTLLLDEEKHPLLEELFAKVLDRLYSHTPFFQNYADKNLSSSLLKSLIEKAKKLLEDNPQKSLTLIDLFPSEEPFRSIYYKMLKGTQDYCLPAKQGYPPLSDYFTFDDHALKPIFFAGLTPDLLEVIFDKNIKNQILEEEALLRLGHKEQTLEETKLKDLLHKSLPANTQIDKMIEYFDFSHAKKRKLPLVHFDEITHIKALKPPLF